MRIACYFRELIMEMRKIPFSPPDISELEIENVTEVLKSGWITTGPKTKELERRLADYIGVKKVTCLSSATACLEMALRVLEIGPGDEVITCAYTYTASASVVDHVGAKLVLVDCQPDCVEMDYDALENAISENTKAIIPIDLAGIPCDYERIFEIVNRKKALFRPNGKYQEALGRIAVISDAAHALGAQYKTAMVGAVGDFTSFSFHAVKNFTTAEGGALAWKTIPGIDDEEIYNLLQLYSLHGQNKDALSKEKLGGWEYDIVGTWYKCNMTDIMAAIGLAQLDRYEGMLEKRKTIISKYDAAFKPLGVKALDHYNEKHNSSGHLYITRIPNAGDAERREIIVKLAEAGISTNVHYKPLPMMTAYKNLGFDIADFPNAKAYYENEITLPLYTKLTEDDVDYIIDNFTRAIKDFI